GSERAAEVARRFPQAQVVLNVQGDEPFVVPEAVDALVPPLLEDGGAAVSTLCEPVTDDADLDRPHVVKVVTDLRGEALYFSRAAVPFARAGRTRAVRRHVGLYGFRAEALHWFAELAPTPLELSE